MERIEEIEIKLKELHSSLEVLTKKWRWKECEVIAGKIEELEAEIDAIVSEENQN